MTRYFKAKQFNLSGNGNLKQLRFQFKRSGNDRKQEDALLDTF